MPCFRILAASLWEGRIRIGRDCVLESVILFEKTDSGQVSIGDRVHIGGNSKIISIDKIEIEDDVTIAWDCTLYDHNSHPLDWEDRSMDTLREVQDHKTTGDFIRNKDWSHVRHAPIRICRRAWLGFGVTVLKGVTIGEGAVVGAQSVVTRDIPPYCVAAGNPAKVVRRLPNGNGSTT
jgi:acetyltransferase-like isoleucine patch superfamily enzyme